jgi:hypothetical protein
LAKSVFCQREGVSDASLHWWLAEIARRDCRGPKPARASTPAKRRAQPAFVPLRAVPSRPVELQPFELVVAGQIVRVPPQRILNNSCFGLRLLSDKCEELHEHCDSGLIVFVAIQIVQAL